VLHSLAYVCWPVSLAHGLTAGRRAHAWVLWGYGLCAALVALALLVRALSCLGRRQTLRRRRRGAKAYRPAAVRPAALASLSARAARPLTGARPLARAAWPAAPTTAAARRSAPSAGPPGQPHHTAHHAAHHAAGPGPWPLRPTQPGGSE
jgi:hypothetical protein